MTWAKLVAGLVQLANALIALFRENQIRDDAKREQRELDRAKLDELERNQEAVADSAPTDVNAALDGLSGNDRDQRN